MKTIFIWTIALGIIKNIKHLSDGQFNGSDTIVIIAMGILAYLILSGKNSKE